MSTPSSGFIFEILGKKAWGELLPREIVAVELDRDEGFWLARRLCLSVRMKSLETPVRALSAARTPIYNETELFVGRRASRGLVEVYRILRRDKLLSMWQNRAEEAQFSYGITRSLLPVDPNAAIVLGLIEYNTGGMPPTQVEVEYLVHLLNYPLFDMVVPPIIPKLPLDGYVGFIKAFLDVVETTRWLRPHLRRTLVPISRSDGDKILKELLKKNRGHC